MRLCEAVIPADAPRRQRIGVSLIGIPQLVAREFLNVDQAVRIGVEAQIDGLGLQFRAHDHQ